MNNEQIANEILNGLAPGNWTANKEHVMSVLSKHRETKIVNLHFDKLVDGPVILQGSPEDMTDRLAKLISQAIDKTLEKVKEE